MRDLVSKMSQLAHYPKQLPDDFSSSAQKRVIAANVDFYRLVAEKYDSYEPYLFDPVLQKSLQHDLETIASYFVPLGRRPSCLDCGGGTGNLTLKMCAMGWAVTVVDVSDKMLDLLEQRAAAAGHSPKLVHGSIEQFLQDTHEAYDLIAFSSVLHHLYSYLWVVQQATTRLRPGGILYSNYDPVAPRSPLRARLLESLDIVAAKLLWDRRDVVPGIRRRWRKLFSPKDPCVGRPVVSAGDLAEFHARTGVDDGQILQVLLTSGFSIVAHQRFSSGRTKLIRFLNKRLRLLESFKIIAQRDSRQRECEIL